MSAKLMGAVWDLKLSHGKQFLLLALADHAHDDGTRCFPSVEYLAWKTGYDRRHVQRILRDLEDDRLINPVGCRGGGRGQVTEYVIDLSAGEKKAPFRDRGSPGSPTSLTPKRRGQMIDELVSRQGSWLRQALRVGPPGSLAPPCTYCGEGSLGDDTNGPDGKAWHVDQVVASNDGPGYVDGNVVLSCATCSREARPGEAGPGEPREAGPGEGAPRGFLAKRVPRSQKEDEMPPFSDQGPSERATFQTEKGDILDKKGDILDKKGDILSSRVKVEIEPSENHQEPSEEEEVEEQNLSGSGDPGRRAPWGTRAPREGDPLREEPPDDTSSKCLLFLKQVKGFPRDQADNAVYLMELREEFPKVDPVATCRAYQVWLRDNPGKTKNFRSRLRRFFERQEQDRRARSPGSGALAKPGSPAKTRKDYEWLFE